ncbi:MAG: RimK/LysX family protein [Acidimicrobiales bacterium]|jgi:hypothetical protein|nr:RimK/LysX family protein [Acidimicrobiales bacterium]
MKRRAPVTIGWREWALVPELTPVPIKAKIDTGALTSSLHAFRLHEVDDGTRVRFQVQPHQRSRTDSVTIECPITDRRQVRSSNGQLQMRPVIETEIELAGRRQTIELTLTNRDEMGFRLLIGRRALRRRYLVDPGRSFITDPPA